VSEPAISVSALVKEYRRFLGLRRFRAVDSVSFAVPRGSVTALLGPNGSGKTTTLKCILGLLRPTAGEVRLLGRPPRDPEARARLGYLPEESPFPSFMKLEPALAFYAELGRVPRRERRPRAAALLEQVGLGTARDRRIGELSKGMLRRFGLAQALIARPDVLVLDEPTSGLDPFGLRDFREILEAERARGTAVLVSSHLLADVERTCDRVVLLSAGRVRAEGPLPELLAASGGAREPLETFFFRTIDGGGGGAPCAARQP